VSVRRFLRQRAVNIVNGGQYTLHRWYSAEGKLRTFACRTKRVSPFRMIVDVPVVGRIGDRLTSYFDEFGEFEGHISDTMQGSFLLELEMTRAKRAKMAEKLTWLEARAKDPTILDSREHTRYVPRTPHSTLTLADGSVQPCFIIDMSLTGAAVSAEPQPPLGTPLAIGACIGRVVRVFPSGFAVKFIEKQNRDDLTRLILRADPRRPASLIASEPLPAQLADVANG
jgi:hypothetical protein